MKIFTLMTEDAELIATAADFVTAVACARDYANELDALAGDPVKCKGIAGGTWWRISCMSDKGRGMFDVIIDTIDFYPPGTLFPVDTGVSDPIEIPNYLRRQAT